MKISRKTRVHIKRAAFKYVVNVSLMLSFVLPVLSQNGDVFPVPDSYKVEGIPTIKKSEVDHLFFDPISIKSNLIWDADQKNRRLLVTDETNNVYLLDSALSRPIKLTEKGVPNSVRFHPDGGSFLFTSDHEDQENFQLYIYDLEKRTVSKATTLTGKDESIESAVWSKAGGFLHYSKIDYELKVTKLCESISFTERCFNVDLKGIWYVLDSADGRILLKHWKSSSNQSLYLYDIAANALVTIEEKGNSPKGGFAGEHIVYISDGNDRCKRRACVISFDLKSGRAKPLDLPKNLTNTQDLKISPASDYILVQETRDGVDDLRIFKFAKGKLGKEIPRFIKGSFVIWNTRWLGSREIVYTLENNGKPASIQSFNFENGTITDWTKERLPPELDGKVTPPEIIKWKSFDKREISGFMVRPRKGPTRLPVLIRVHGGPQILARPVFNSNDIRLASQLGVAIIHTNIRGSSGFGSEFMDADDREKRGDAIKDIRALIDWIEKQGDLDPGQIFLRGESYGGFVVLSAAMQEPSRVKGVIAESPIVSIRGYLSQSWIDDFAKTEYGNPDDEKLMVSLDALSPLNNADRWNKIPLLLTRGKRDGRIPENNVVDLKNQLQKQGTDVWYIYSTEGGHGFGGRYVFASIYKFLKTQIENRRK
ncbi:MAG TPA: prolyl oligopeptidase family serine peptidase [Pyrinomonadaceae bacterium]|nr:prolyl oligopeptidase family serine peptidase [Pyrinomonadaceae bacterium]